MDFEGQLRPQSDAGVAPPSVIDSCLQPIVALRPTQIAVGWREVEAKLRRRQLGSSEHPDVVPVILGPGQRVYLRDRHHLVLALHRAGVASVRVAYIDDLSHLDTVSLWPVLEERRWVYPYDENGERKDFEQIPASVLQLADDPFRSLAGELRRRGGFSKSKAPYAEFAWADFLRRRIARALVEQDFEAALAMASVIARSDAARHLPGCCASPEAHCARRDGALPSGDMPLRKAV